MLTALTLTLTPTERATLMAALHYFELHAQDSPDDQTRDLATMGGALAPIDAQGFDDLTQRLAGVHLSQIPAE